MATSDIITGTSIALNYIFLIGLVIAAILGIIFIMSSRAIQMKASTGLLQTKPPLQPLQTIRKGKFLRRMVESINQKTPDLIKQKDIQDFVANNCTREMTFLQEEQESGVFMTLPQQFSIASEICKKHQNAFGKYRNYDDPRQLFKAVEQHEPVREYTRIYEECVYGEPKEKTSMDALIHFCKLQQQVVVLMARQ